MTFCSSDPNNLIAAALVELAYATRGGVLTSASQYGSDELRLIFNDTQNQATIAISGIIGGPEQVASTMVTTYRLSGASPSERIVGSPIQLQRYENPSHQFDPDKTLVLTQDQLAFIETDLMRRNLVHPASHDKSCARAFADWDISTLDNRSRDSWRVIHSAKVICATSYTNIPPVTCNDNDVIPTEPKASHCAAMAVAATPESCNLLHSRGTSVTQYRFCCDPGISIDENNRSEVALQSSRSVVTEKILTDGTTRILDPFYWASVKTDIQPSAIGTAPPSAVAFSWFDFDGRTPELFDAEDCAPGSGQGNLGDLDDVDGDGLFDNCDFLVASETTQQGGDDVLLRYSLRNAEFNNAGATLPNFSGVPEVRIGSETIIDITATADDITITVPQNLPLGAFPVQVCPDATCNDPGISRDLLSVRRKAYVAIGGMDYIRPFDEVTGEFLDIDPAYTNAVPNLPVSGPFDVAFTIESGNESKEVLISVDNEIYVHDEINRDLLDLDDTVGGVQGISVGGTVVQMAFEPYGEFLFALHGTKDLTIIDARREPGPSGTTNPRFTTYPLTGLSSTAQASHLSVKALQGDQYMAYVTFSCLDCGHLLATYPSCPENPLPPPSAPLAGASAMGGITPCPPGGCGGDEPGGGGGSGGGSNGPRRYLGVAAIHLQANFEADNETLQTGANAFSVICYEDVVLSAFGGITGETLDQGALPWSQLGMDFSTDGLELFIANPETESLFILDTSTNELVAPGGVPVEIIVGQKPVAIEIIQVKNQAGSDVDRAYVANDGDQTMTIVSTSARAEVATRDLAQDFAGLPNLNINMMAGSSSSMLLFLVTPENQRLLKYSFDPSELGVHGDLPSPKPPILVGPSPGRIALRP